MYLSETRFCSVSKVIGPHPAHSDRPTMNVLASKQEEQVVLVDPSEFRPDMQYDPQKATEDFRNFEVNLDDV